MLVLGSNVGSFDVELVLSSKSGKSRSSRESRESSVL